MKKAYRQLALQYHPDKNPGDTKAEERSKETSEASAALSDPDKRAQYDRFGTVAGPGGFDASDLGFGTIFDDLFAGFFGAGGRGGPPPPAPGGGGPPTRGAPAGDLYVVIRLRPHPFFTRHGDDLLCELPLSFPQAALGTEAEGPVLGGHARLPVAAGT